jgi:hypothetical protein
MSNFAPLGLKNTMPFGKHRGLTIRNLIDEKLFYIEWLLTNTETKFDDEAAAYIVEAMEKKGKPDIAAVLLQAYPKAVKAPEYSNWGAF